MDLLSAGGGSSRSWHSLPWHQWVAALRAEAAVLAHDPRRSPPPRQSQSARRSQPDRGRPHPRLQAWGLLLDALWLALGGIYLATALALRHRQRLDFVAPPADHSHARPVVPGGTGAGQRVSGCWQGGVSARARWRASRARAGSAS